ncbi:hypothetical protein FN846DRAFT_909018 [Sphaerosporella brunnea]|uniref:Myb/SANT-like domain-containing protein n=1 Tax=Sphaerosporella brunnea TaxID=1250544 RepID=A0A5J5ER23_9PEZI|nr:hypothetical protein FN846DRAFT_909018 [Sphaerosporella brunnea]
MPGRKQAKRNARELSTEPEESSSASGEELSDDSGGKEEGESTIGKETEKQGKGKRKDKGEAKKAGKKKEARSASASWINDMTTTLIRKMLDMKRAGPAVNKRYKMTMLRKDWKMFRDLTHLSGFGYDGEVSTCSDDVWTSYVQKHPGGAKFRRHGLENYEELDELYSAATATKPETPGTQMLLAEPAVLS